MDGANCAISFSPQGELLLQSRGHFLSGGPREKHWDLFKSWASCYQEPLREILKDRSILYGEWLYAKHTVYYTALPHYFLEFDLLDREEGEFLSTEKRREILGSLPFVISVRVVQEGEVKRVEDLQELVEPSPFIGKDHLEILRAECLSRGIDPVQTLAQTDPSGLMEGLYIKWEEDGVVKGRYKFVRSDFLTTVLNSGGHWLNRPILPNLLKEGVDIFGGAGL